jgi:hypothetical protein
MKNLLIGYFYNVKSFEGIKVFIKSVYTLKNKSFNTVLLDASDDGLEEEIKEFAKHYDVLVVKIKKQIDSLYIDRFQAYKEYLDQTTTTYQHIILSDCTDVYFQRDPFEDLIKLDTGLILSSENALIKDIKWNYDIIKNVYGYEIADCFIEKPIINSGIIAGNLSSIKLICDLIVSEHSQKHKCFTGVDQGILMKIIYSKQYPERSQFAPYNFSLMLAAGFGFTNKLINNYGINIDKIKITDNSNNLYSIIHQYNRNSSFNQKVISYFLNRKEEEFV